MAAAVVSARHGKRYWSMKLKRSAPTYVGCGLWQSLTRRPRTPDYKQMCEIYNSIKRKRPKIHTQNHEVPYAHHGCSRDFVVFLFSVADVVVVLLTFKHGNLSTKYVGARTAATTKKCRRSHPRVCRGVIFALIYKPFLVGANCQGMDLRKSRK